jgi:glycosyltransferase involved in cell wall biosynthesis
MRVVHVASGRLFGGIEQMLLTIARCREVTPGVDVSFAVAAPGRLEADLRAARANICDLGDVRLSRPASVVQARARLGRLIERDRPDVLVCHAPWSFALFAPVGRRNGLRVVCWQHDHASGRSLVERWARRTSADLVVCNSRWTSRTAAALQPGVPVVVIHPPVMIPESPPGTRARVRQTLDAGESDVVILTASRFEPWKGHLNLLGALGRMTEIGPWMLWIAGAPQRPHEQEYAGLLQREVERLGIGPRVRFLGDRRDIGNLMSASDLYCQMNEGPEPFGIAFAEALLSGLPVVTANLGGASEIVSESCGRLVAPGDLDSLTETLRELVVDRAMRARLAAGAVRHALSRCAPEIVLRRLARALGAGATAAA